jgi:hypothetical protein
MKLLRLIFLPYIGLGLFTGVTITVSRSGRPSSPKEVAILAGIHVLLIGGAVALAATSKTRDGKFRFGLSPAGWGIGLALTYVVGFVMAFFIK